MSCTSRVHLLTTALVIIAAACDDPADPVRTLAPFTVTPATLYAGTEVKIVGADAARLMDITLARRNAAGDSIPLEIVRRNADTVVVSVPSTTHGGDYALRMRGHVLPIANVTIAGFREAPAHDELVCNLDVPSGAVASVVATRGNALVKLFPATGVIRELIPASYLNQYQYAIGRSYRPEIAFVLPSQHTFEAWNIAGAPQLVETVPYSFDNALYQISDSVFISTRNNSTFSYKLRSGSFVPVFLGPTFDASREYHEPTGALISPNGDFGLVMYSYSPTHGQPVYDGATGRPRYHIPLSAAYYARFSVSRDTLYLAGDDDATNLLLAIDPRNGAELNRRDMGAAGTFQGVAVDAINSRLFVAMRQGGIINIHVLDSRTLEPQARLQGVPATSSIACGQLVFDNSGIFVVDTDRTYEFDYLP